VKAAYDHASTAIAAASSAGATASLAQATANAALPKAGGTMTGLITFAPGQTFPGTAGVTQILAGTNITVTPAGGTGVVTIDATGGSAPVPATPVVEGIVFGCTDSVTNFNTALGYNALLAPTSLCIANVAIGSSAGNAITDGYGNTLVGPGTGCAVTTGTVNTAVGIGALSGATTGFANVSVGICSGCAYTVESGNAVFGGYYGDAGDINALILSDGAGNLKAKFNGVGALSLDGTNYGAAGEVLTSNGPAAKPSWQAAGGVTNATPTTAGLVFGYVGASLKTDSNAGIGLNALLNAAPIVTASNAAFGTRALQSLSAGGGNTALGWASLESTATGNDNTAVGAQAGGNADGIGNTMVGQTAGQNVVGDSNAFFGTGAAQSQASGDNNVAIGPNVALANNTGSCQLSIGFSGTENWLTGDSTQAIKPGAGIIDCSGSCGTAGQVLSSNGSNAIEWVTGGSGATPATPAVEGIVYGCTDSTNFNYGLGDGILGALTTGTLNIAIGTGALATTDSGTSNTAVGIGALFGNTSGTQNVALGQQALFSATTAGLNTAIGSQALQNTTGDANTALGNFAGNVLTTGCSNILIGNQAGGAGAGALDTGNNNVVIGNCVSVVSNTGDCQLAIGVNTICWLTGTSTGAIKPGAGIIDCANSCGTNGQVLMSNGANAVRWGGGVSGTYTFGTCTVVITNGLITSVT
jgi:hypothetical protein